MEASGLLTLFFNIQIVFDIYLLYTLCETFHLVVLSLSQLLITIATKEVILKKTHTVAQSEILFRGVGIGKVFGEMTIVIVKSNPQQLDEATN